MTKIYQYLLISLLVIACSTPNIKLHESGKASNKTEVVKSEYVDVDESFLSDPDFQGNKTTDNFVKAKHILKDAQYFGINEEIYCGCEFSNNEISKDAKCGILPRKNEKRAYRIEFEHIVPFENQVGHTVAWKIGVPECHGHKGRKCASKVFAHMEGDLWNLWPSAGELNGDRSNYSYGMVKGSRDQYGKCDFKVEDHHAEPRDEVKALVAFTYMYFQKTYAKFLKKDYVNKDNEKMFEEWSRLPLTETQCSWAKRVYQVQGNGNGDLLEACSKLSK